MIREKDQKNPFIFCCSGGGGSIHQCPDWRKLHQGGSNQAEGSDQLQLLPVKMVEAHNNGDCRLRYPFSEGSYGWRYRYRTDHAVHDSVLPSTGSDFPAVTLATYVFIVFLIYKCHELAVFTLYRVLRASCLIVVWRSDSNILTFERIQGRLLYSGRECKTIAHEGAPKSFITIFDARVTTFINALILYMMGAEGV